MIRRISLALIVAGLFCSPALAITPFRFENEVSLSAMQALVRQDVPVGSPRQQLQTLFVGQGGATLKTNPTQVGVEKYVYDINLCSYYV